MKLMTNRILFQRLLMLCLAVVTSLSGCQRGGDKMSEHNLDVLATPGRSVTSPSGEYILKVIAEREDGNEVARFQVLNTQGTVIYDNGTNYSLRHTTFFLWADHTDQVWVYSGDIGTSFWQMDEDGVWTEHDGRSEKAEVPRFLKRARPQFFKN
jgi:hypothetical protein